MDNQLALFNSDIFSTIIDIPQLTLVFPISRIGKNSKAQTNVFFKEYVNKKQEIKSLARLNIDLNFISGLDWCAILPNRNELFSKDSKLRDIYINWNISIPENIIQKIFSEISKIPEINKGLINNEAPQLHVTFTKGYTLKAGSSEGNAIHSVAKEQIISCQLVCSQDNNFVQDPEQIFLSFNNFSYTREVSARVEKPKTEQDVLNLYSNLSKAEFRGKRRESFKNKAKANANANAIEQILNKNSNNSNLEKQQKIQEEFNTKEFDLDEID